MSRHNPIQYDYTAPQFILKKDTQNTENTKMVNQFSNHLLKRIQKRPTITQIQTSPPPTGKQQRSYATVITHPQETQNIQPQETTHTIPPQIVRTTAPTQVTPTSTLTSFMMTKTLLEIINVQQNKQLEDMMEKFQALLKSTLDSMLTMITTIITTILNPIQSKRDNKGEHKENNTLTTQSIQQLTWKTLGSYQSTVASMQPF